MDIRFLAIMMGVAIVMDLLGRMAKKRNEEAAAAEAEALEQARSAESLPAERTESTGRPTASTSGPAQASGSPPSSGPPASPVPSPPAPVPAPVPRKRSELADILGIPDLSDLPDPDGWPFPKKDPAPTPEPIATEPPPDRPGRASTIDSASKGGHLPMPTPAEAPRSAASVPRPEPAIARRAEGARRADAPHRAEVGTHAPTPIAEPLMRRRASVARLRGSATLRRAVVARELLGAPLALRRTEDLER